MLKNSNKQVWKGLQTKSASKVSQNKWGEGGPKQIRDSNKTKQIRLTGENMAINTIELFDKQYNWHSFGGNLNLICI